MNQTNKETWNDGQLRSLQVVINGLPENNTEPALPDELFLETVDGERLTEVIRESDGYHVYPEVEWTESNTFESYSAAFKHALTYSRTRIED